MGGGCVITIHGRLLTNWDDLTSTLKSGKACNVDVGEKFVLDQEKFLESLAGWYKEPVVLSIPTDGPGKDAYGRATSYTGILRVTPGLPSNKAAKSLLKKK